LKYRYLDGQVISYNDCNSYTVSYDYLSAYPGKKTSIEVKNPAGTTIYSVNYTYDLAGNITEVNDTQAVDSNIALMTYDDNGRLSELKYWLSGNVGGPNVAALYAYNPDNRLTDIELAGGPVYTFDVCDVNGIWAGCGLQTNRLSPPMGMSLTGC